MLNTLPDPHPSRVGRRCAIVAVGRDENDVEAIALWWTDRDGGPQAGWLYPVADAFGDPAIARRLLRIARGRTIVGRAGTVQPILRGLARAAGLPAGIDALADFVELSEPADPARMSGVDHRCPVIRDVLAMCGLLAPHYRTSVAVGSAV